MTKHKRIEGVVVLYEPDFSVIDHIKSYIDCLERLYVVDNSITVNNDVVEAIKGIDKCQYIKNDINEGIASALNTGAKLAIANGANWLLTMDQDSEFENGGIFKLIDFAKEQDDTQIGIVSPHHQTKVSIQPKTDVEEGLTIMTSGNLLNLTAYQTIGGFDEQYFIDAVDWDFCLRLAMHNFKVIKLNTVALIHNLGKATNHASISGKQVIALNYNKTRRYYITRNKLMIIGKYFKTYPEFCFLVFKSLFRDLRQVLFYEDGKAGKLSYILKGFFHFIFKKTGKQL